MKKRIHLSEMFDNSLREQRKIQKIKEQDARTNQYKQTKQVEKERLESEIQLAMQRKDFAKAIYLDKKIKEMENNEQKNN